MSGRKKISEGLIVRRARERLVPPSQEGDATDMPVVLTVTVPARRRTDLPDIFTAEIECNGRVVLRRHFRQGDDGPEDVTALVADILTSRARGAKVADRHAQAVQLAQVGAKTPREHRAAHGSLVNEETTVAGRTRARALSSLGTIRQRDLLTMRQFEAGDRMGADAKVIAGAREAKEDGVGDGVPSRRDWEDFVIEAGRRLNLVREACMSMAWFEGVSPWLMVDAIVLKDRTLTDAAGSNSVSVLRRAKTALRIGLDAAGDAYRLPAAVTRTNVLRDGIPVVMTVTEDIDGRDRDDNLRRLWRAITLDGKPWVAVGADMSDLYAVAKKHLKGRPATK